MAYRFLVVDDTSFMRKMAADCLRQFGYEVAGEASNGKEAVQLYEELRPDVVLMDLTMPEMSGCDAIKAILAINPDAVVLICSASNQKELIFEAMEAGAKGYLMKPFNSSRLQEVIRKYAEPFLTPQDIPETASQSEVPHESPTPEDEEGSAVGAVEAVEAVEAAERTETAETVERTETGDEALDEIAAETDNIAKEQEPETGHVESGALTRDHKSAADLNRGNGKLKSFVSSFMCNWQEERNGVTADYSAVYTESENQLFIERRDANDEKQTIPFTLDGFRQLSAWLENNLSVRKG